jgi:hypothetical protein
MNDLSLGFIHFRNSGHAFWFYQSMLVLVVLMAIYLFLKIRLFMYAAANHLVTSVIAIIVVVILRRASETYSIDCVWFNGLMFVVYAVLLYATKARERELKKPLPEQ